MTASALAIIAPTASGKTALSLRIAAEVPCEIISLDSALVYQDMDIGTAKPSAAEQAAVPHHLIDIITPMESYSAADFVGDCVRLAGEIRARGRLPLIVGGTMMYYHALTQGLNELPEADAAVRAELETAARLPPGDSQRIERALEVFLLTGKPLSQHIRAAQSAPALPLHTIALIPEDRSRLHAQINRRFEQMLDNGFVGEVRHLQQKYPDLPPDGTAMRCVGYRQVWQYLDGQINESELVAQGQAATRQLAKRQLTWLRKLPTDAVFDPFGAPDYVQAACETAQTLYSSLKSAS